MSTSRPATGSAGVPVRILPVPPRSPIVVLFLSAVRGLITHWSAKQSFACPGDDRCAPAIHRCRSLWKGYAAVECWQFDVSAWIPAVLEVTENLEEQLRGMRLRGQVWSLERSGTKKKGDPVNGLFLETRKAELVSPAFDIVPALQRLYHTSELKLDVPNPTPSQLLLPPVLRPGPTLPEPPAERIPSAATEEQLAEIRKLAGRAGRAHQAYRENATRPSNGIQETHTDRSGER
jgi:hypothetical protein